MEQQSYELTAKEREVILQGIRLYEQHLHSSIADIEAINTLSIGDLQNPRYDLLRRFQSELRICNDLKRKLRI